MKHHRLSDTDRITAKLDEVVAGIKAIQRRNDFTDNLSLLFECVVCKDVIQVPAVSEPLV